MIRENDSWIIKIKNNLIRYSYILIETERSVIMAASSHTENEWFYEVVAFLSINLISSTAVLIVALISFCILFKFVRDYRRSNRNRDLAEKLWASYKVYRKFIIMMMIQQICYIIMVASTIVVREIHIFALFIYNQFLYCSASLIA